MTASPSAPARPVARRSARGSVLLRLLRTTDHKQIGIMYLVTSFAFFMVGGAMAMLIRTELARPGQQFLSQEQYNQLFTMHGTIMLLYATPILRIAQHVEGAENGRLRRRRGRMVANVGDFEVLRALRRIGPPYAMTPSQLRAEMLISSSGLTGRLHRLERDGWIMREPRPTTSAASWSP